MVRQFLYVDINENKIMKKRMAERADYFMIRLIDSLLNTEKTYYSEGSEEKITRFGKRKRVINIGDVRVTKQSY